MARYAVASGNWNDTAVWSTTDGGAPGASFPVDGDLVFFTAASGAITVTVNVSSACTSIDATGYTGTFTGSAALQLKGNLTAVAGMTYSYTGTITEALTAGTATLTSAGKTLCGALTMNGAGGTLTFGDAFVTTGTCTHTAGTITQANFDLTFGSYSSTGTGTRAFNYAASSAYFVNITGSGTCWTLSGASGYSNNVHTLSAAGGQAGMAVVRFTYSGAASRTLSMTDNISGAAVWGISSIWVSAGSGTFTASSPNYGVQCGGSLNFTGFSGTFAGAAAANIYALGMCAGDVTLSGTMAITASNGGFVWYQYAPAPTEVYVWTSNGVTLPTGSGYGLTVSATGAGTSDSTWLFADAFSCTGHIDHGYGEIDFDGQTITVRRFSSSNATTRTINFGAGGTLNLTGTAASVVWDTSTSTGLTVAGSGTIALTGVTASTRTISANSVQLPSIAVNAGSGAITFTNVNCDSLTFGNSYSGTIANQTITIRGSVQLSNHASFALTAGANAWTLAATATGKTFTSQGKAIDFPLTFNGVGGGWTFADALTHGITRTLTLTNGALSFGTGLTHTMGFFSSSNANTRTIDSGTSTLNFPTTGTVWDTSTSTNLTMAGTGTIALTANSATARTITGGGVELPSLLMAVGNYAPTFTSCNFLSFTNTAGWSGTLANQTLTIRGSISLSSAGTYSSGSNTWTWACASGSALFTMNGKTLAWPLSVSAAGGEHYFADVPVFSAATTVTGAGPLGAQDNFTMPAVGTWTFTGPWTYAPTGAGKLVTFNALLPTTGTITVNGSGSIVLQDAPPAMSQANAFTVAAGELDTGSFNITTYSLTFSGSGVRTLTLGSSTVTLTGTGTVLDASGTNQTVNAGTSVVTQTDGTSTLKTLNLGNKSWATVRVKKSGTNRVAIAGGAGAMAFDLAA